MSTPKLLARLWREWIRPLALPCLAMLAAKSAFGDAEFVPTGSMKPTILEGDEVVVNKLAYDLKVPFTTVHMATWGNPARGDIVVFFRPPDGERLVKRVVGLPGDVVEMRNERLTINGRPLHYGAPPERALRDLDGDDRSAAVFGSETLGDRVHAVMALPERPALRDFGPVRVPPNAYLVLGDNRDNSADSRYFGFVTRDRIVGKAEAVAFSIDLRHYRPRLDRFFSRF
jgi:signal peptidase I